MGTSEQWIAFLNQHFDALWWLLFWTGGIGIVRTVITK